MTDKVDLSYELSQIKRLVKDHDIAVSEMRGNDAEGIRFQIADACQDFVLGNLVSLESALADQRRYRYLRDIGHPDSDEGLAVLVGTMTEWGRWVHIHKSGVALDAAIDALPLDQEGE